LHLIIIHITSQHGPHRERRLQVSLLLRHAEIARTAQRTPHSTNLLFLNFGVRILSRVLDRIEGFRLTQLDFNSFFYYFIQIIRYMFRLYDHLQVNYIHRKLTYIYISN
jgi:hypothetical protein